MLTYHPAFDSYHCAFRILLLTSKGNLINTEAERIRIWDFYLVFPYEAKRITFPKELQIFRNVFNKKVNTYEELVDSQRIFERMKPYQMNALNYLAAYGFIDSKMLIQNRVVRTDKSIPSQLSDRMDNLNVMQRNVINIIQSPLNDLELYGSGGLKFRTKLLDYKYDAA